MLHGPSLYWNQVLLSFSDTNFWCLWINFPETSNPNLSMILLNCVTPILCSDTGGPLCPFAVQQFCHFPVLWEPCQGTQNEPPWGEKGEQYKPPVLTATPGYKLCSFELFGFFTTETSTETSSLLRKKEKRTLEKHYNWKQSRLNLQIVYLKTLGVDIKELLLLKPHPTHLKPHSNAPYLHYPCVQQAPLCTVCTQQGQTGETTNTQVSQWSVGHTHWT